MKMNSRGYLLILQVQSFIHFSYEIFHNFEGNCMTSNMITDGHTHLFYHAHL